MIIFFLWLLTMPALAANPFNMGKVEYFFEHKSLSQGLEKIQKSIDWREPIMGVDGKMTYYTPPEPVLHLLQDPSIANAQAYMDWQKQKDERIAKAQLVLGQLSEPNP